MRARATVAGAVGAAAVLAIAWQVGAVLDTSSGGGTAAGPTATGSPAATAASNGSFTGASESTRYGSVQVKIVVAGGAITDVVAVHLTDKGGRSVQLSNRAAPILRAEVLKSQSAKVASVSGATYTTDAYLLSLQSALDQAGL
ncbi:FMN-binding protein [Lacisediminihabitans sp. FW035]